MSSLATGAIDIAEAAYDLEVGAADWLARVLEAGRQTFDLGLGAAAALMSGISPGGEPLVTQLIPGTARPGLNSALVRAAQQVGPDMVQQTVDAIAGGVNIPMPSPKTIRLSKRARDHWRMLVIHITAAHRLRRGLMEPTSVRGIAPTELPLNAEALLDPKSFRVSEAIGGARDKEASETIRDAAVRIDKARSKLRRADPERALETWQGLVRGRWSLLDWFDTDGRRFVIAKPNAPNIGDPRGLTEREAQVVTYAAVGETATAMLPSS